MDIFDGISLLGGLAMFLYGMRLMGDSLKENSSGALKLAMEKVTNNPFKAFLLGICVTALIQSSTAMIVITAGLVGAGILTLHQSLGIIVGANVGTTVTGQIIRLLDIDSSGAAWLRFFQPSTLAPLALILGMLLIMGHFVKNGKSLGSIAVGFGILFSGLMNMTGAVHNLTQSGGPVEQLLSGLGDNPVLGYLTGAGVAFMLQSSSVTVGILQAFSASGMLSFKAIYAVIVGIYLGDCVTTAIVVSIGAKPEAKRVGVVNILFNLSETVLVLLGVTVAHRLGLLDSLWDRTVNSGMIANTNTIFNLSCSICLFPMLNVYEKLSRRIVKDEPAPAVEEKYREELDGLNPGFVNTPALALNGCYQVLLTMLRASRENIEKSFLLLEHYDEALHREILAEEENVDHLTDCCSRYMVELLPHLRLEQHVAILNQYYKVTAEFGLGAGRHELLAGRRGGAPCDRGRAARDPGAHRGVLPPLRRERRPRDRAAGAARGRAGHHPPAQPPAPPESRPVQHRRRQQLFQPRRGVSPHRGGVLERGGRHGGAPAPGAGRPRAPVLREPAQRRRRRIQRGLRGRPRPLLPAASGAGAGGALRRAPA